jgi:hypothetical protein
MTSKEWIKMRNARQRNAHGSGLLAHIEAAERQAHRDGFHVTAHALNRAKNACGWEMAGDIEQAGKASRDDR